MDKQTENTHDHHRVFPKVRDAERRELLNAMIRKSEEMGLYDFEEADIETPSAG